MSLFEYTLLALSSLFVIIDPIGAIPTFLTITSHNTVAQRIDVLRLACILTASLLIFFALLGKWIFLILGITLPALQIAGGLVLLFVSYDMLRTQRSPLQETVEEKEVGIRKEDVAITPLAIPMLAGPGAISTVILLENKASNFPQKLSLYFSVIIISLISYLILKIVAKGRILFGPIGSKIIIRLMGLFLTALAVQFMINGVASLNP